MKSKLKFKGFEKENGEIVPTAYVNGYNFGDRLLEGVYFKATVQSNGTLSVDLTEDAEEYMRNLNKTKWLKEALIWFETVPDGYSTEPNDGDEVVLIPA